MHVESKTGCAPRFTAGRQISHFLHSGRAKQSIHAIFVTGNYAGDLSNAKSLRRAPLFTTKMLQPLMEKNLIKGGSLENAIVVRGDAVLSKEPLRFLGRIRAAQNSRYHRRSCAGRRRIRGHVMAVKPGHAANADLAREIARKQTRRSLRFLFPRTFPIGEGGLDINRSDGDSSASLTLF